MRNKAHLEQEGGWQESADPVGRIIRHGWALLLEVADDAWEGKKNHLLEDADGDLGGVDKAASSVPWIWKLFGSAGAGGDKGLHCTALIFGG